MSFDIALGKCIDVDDDCATVAVDHAMLSRLRPGAFFAFPSKAVMRVPLFFCSSLRLAKPGLELFVDSERVQQGGDAHLDILGGGSFLPVDIRLLAHSAPRVSLASQPVTRRASNWPINQ